MRKITISINFFSVLPDSFLWKDNFKMLGISKGIKAKGVYS